MVKSWVFCGLWYVVKRGESRGGGDTAPSRGFVSLLNWFLYD